MDDLFKIIKTNSDFVKLYLIKTTNIFIKNISELDKGAGILKYLLKSNKMP